MPRLRAGSLFAVFCAAAIILTVSYLPDAPVKAEELIVKITLDNVYSIHIDNKNGLPWYINVFVKNDLPYKIAFQKERSCHNAYNNPSGKVMHSEELQALAQKGDIEPESDAMHCIGDIADYDYLMRNFYNVHASTTAPRSLMNADKFLSEDFKVEKDGSPQILIYHTHSSETYADSKSYDLPEGSVVGVGNALCRLLTEKGYNVIHDTTVYDVVNGKLDRSRAYTYALGGITEILDKNPSISVILDIHRDGVSENTHLATVLDGKKTARIMFFNGMSSTPSEPIEYLPNPYKEDNLAFSFQLQIQADRYYPGFTRKIYLKGLRYNLHLRKRSALIEVGAQTNTYEEAVNAAVPMAEILDMVLQGS